MLKATKIRLYPNAEQRGALNFQFGAMRWAYNHTLHWRSTAWKEHKQRVTQDMAEKALVTLKKQKGTEWLKGADSQALQQSLRHLQHAYERFFKGLSRYPKFKNRHARQSMTYPQRVVVSNDRKALHLPKVGDVKAVFHRALPEQAIIKSVTVSRTTTGKYFASVLCETGEPAPKPRKNLDANAVIGVDLGLTHFATTSDGCKAPNPKWLKAARANLRRKQKSLSRKVKGSANRAKARLLVAKAHERARHARNDYQHKLSKRLIDENQAVCVETLKIMNMLKNRRLARHISDAAWHAFVQKLCYKALWSGKHVAKIDPWFPSSKTCSSCGVVRESLDLSVRAWTCGACGSAHDRDVNASLNIRKQGILNLQAAGLSVSAC